MLCWPNRQLGPAMLELVLVNNEQVSLICSLWLSHFVCQQVQQQQMSVRDCFRRFMEKSRKKTRTSSQCMTGYKACVYVRKEERVTDCYVEVRSVCKCVVCLWVHVFTLALAQWWGEGVMKCSTGVWQSQWCAGRIWGFLGIEMNKQH